MSDAPERIWADWSPADEDTMPATIGCYTPKTREVARWKRVDYVRADHIEQLTAERDGLLRCVTDNHVALCRAEKAEADNARLREALDETAQILSQCTFETIRVHGQYIDTRETVSRARAALKGESHE